MRRSVLGGVLVGVSAALVACSLVTGFSDVVLEGSSADSDADVDGDVDTDTDVDTDVDTDADSDADVEPCDPGDPGACSDGWACTDDYCDVQALGCVNAPNDESCGLGLACAPWDRDADARGCVYVGACDPADCDDGFECTEEVCRDGGCGSEPRDEWCEGGRCAPGAEGADDRGCLPPLGCSGNEECEDGYLCSIDSCVSGACATSYDDSSCASRRAPPCHEWVCDPWGEPRDDSGCVLTPAFAGSSCSPVNRCFVDGMCNTAGECVPRGEPCDDGIPCTVDVCVGDSGACVHLEDDAACPGDRPFCLPADAEGDSDGCRTVSCTETGSCGDSQSCNGVESCSSGLCRPGPASTGTPCPRLASCSVAVCSYGEGCLHAGNVLACDDGDPCTVEACDPLAPVGSGCSTTARRCDAMRFDGCCPSGCSAASDMDCGL